MTTALVIIDLQKAILPPIEDTGRRSRLDATLNDVAIRLGRLKAEAESAGMPVILIQHDGDPGHRLEKGTAGWRFRDEVLPGPGTIVVHKRNCDAFHDTDLDARLRALRIKRLVVGGCMTQFCVDTTVRRAVSIGYDVTLIEDGHATSDFGILTAEQIVDHHNRLLSGFEAGSSSVNLDTADAMRLFV